MKIVSTLDPREDPVSVAFTQYTLSDSSYMAKGVVQEETFLDLKINGRWNMRLSCSANHLDELVVGRLYASGYIADVRDIESIHLCQDPFMADVAMTRRQIGRLTVSDAQKLTEAGILLEPVRPISWDVAWVMRLASVFAEDKTSHRRTRGVHSAYLASATEVLCWREDIGRHNAFDKVVGWALLNEVDLSQCLLYSSGRVPADMAVKAIRSRIPVLVSKAVATDKAVALACDYDLTLICNATPTSMAVLNGQPQKNASAA